MSESSFINLPALSSHFFVLSSKRSRGTIPCTLDLGLFILFCLFFFFFFQNICHLGKAWTSSPGPLCFFRVGFFLPKLLRLHPTCTAVFLGGGGGGQHITLTLFCDNSSLDLQAGTALKPVFPKKKNLPLFIKLLCSLFLVIAYSICLSFLLSVLNIKLKSY